MTHLTLFNPSFRRLFADPFFDLPVRFGTPAGGKANGASLWSPPVDVRETDSEVVVEAELPGIPREDISVRYHDGRLILEGQRKEVRATGPETDAPGVDDPRADDPGADEPKAAPAANAWLRRERAAGSFHRSFDLPESVDSSAIRADSRDGVLRVVLPKLKKAQPRRIEVSVH